MHGKVVVITGATSGIGRVAARLFAEEGANVVFSGRRNDLGAELAIDIDGTYVSADHRCSEDCEKVVQTAVAKFGRIDVLFNNAGIVLAGTAEETSEWEWDATFSLNVTAVWRMSRLVIPIMRNQGGGAIVNNASDWGLVGARNAVAYAASKGAVIQMTRSMALDHARERVRINAICPGDTYVERWQSKGYFDNRQIPASSQVGSLQTNSDIPLGRVASANEVADVVLFLSSERASYITGACLAVDGGTTAQ